MSTCVFCDIVAGEAPAKVVYGDERAVAFVPLNPVTPGHLLVVPREHQRYVWELYSFPDDAIRRLAKIAALNNGGVNIIQSNGEAATQSIGHVHFHIVPRRHGDGLHLPWTCEPTKPEPKEVPRGPSD